VRGINTDVFDEFSTGTDFASEVGIASDYRASAIAQTAYRSNRITASAGKDVEDGFSQGGATSRWSDGLFFEGGVGTGFVTFKFMLSGNIEGDDTVGFNFDFDAEDEYCCSDNVGEVFRGPLSVSGFEISLEAEFTYNSEANGDEPIVIEAQLFGSAIVSRGDTGDVTTQFGNSAILVEVILPDGTSVSSTSGTDYSRVIPEPGALVLFALGGILLERKRLRLLA